MIKWLKELFLGEEDSYYEECIRRDAQIRDIRRRIEEQRNSLSSSQSFHVERYEKVAQPIPFVEQISEKEKREADLADLKAKLTRRK